MANSLLDFYGQQPGGEAQPRTSTATRPRSLLDAYQPTPQDVARAKAVPQAPAPSAPNQDAGLWSDTANLAKMGIGQLGQGAGYLTGIESLEKAGAGLAERSMQALSPAQQQAMQNEFVTHSDEEGYGVGPALTETPLRSLYGALVSSLPATAAGMGVGGLAAKGLGAAGSALATRGVAGGATLARPAVSGAVGFGAGEGLVSAGIAGSDVQDFVRNADQELLDQAPGYQELIAQGMDPDTAREALAEELAANAALGSGAVVGLLGAPMGALFGRWMGGAGPQTVRGAVLGGAAGEAGQEAAQSAAEEYVGGTQRAQIDPTQAPTLASMANQAVGGALAGGAMGAGFGAFQGYAQQKRQSLLDAAGVDAGRLPETAAEPVEQPSQQAAEQEPPPRERELPVVRNWSNNQLATLRERLRGKESPAERDRRLLDRVESEIRKREEAAGAIEGEPTRPLPKRPADPQERRYLTLENRARNLEAQSKTLPEGQQETLDTLRETLQQRPVRDERVRALLDRYGQPTPAAGESRQEGRAPVEPPPTVPQETDRSLSPTAPEQDQALDAQATPLPRPDQADQAEAQQPPRPQVPTDQAQEAARPETAKLGSDTADTNQPSQQPEAEGADSVAQFVPTHEAPDGTPLRATDEPDVYTDAEGVEIEEANATPVAPAAAPDGTVSQDQLERVRGIDGQYHYVRKDQLNSDRPRLRRYTKDGRPHEGDRAVIVRENLDPDGTKAKEAYKDLPYIAASDNRRDKPFANESQARAAVERHGQDPADFDYRPHQGGVIAVRKQAAAQPAEPPAADLAERYNVTPQPTEDKARSYGRGRYGKEPFTVVEQGGKFYAVPQGAAEAAPVHTDTDGDTEPATRETVTEAMQDAAKATKKPTAQVRKQLLTEIEQWSKAANGQGDRPTGGIGQVVTDPDIIGGYNRRQAKGEFVRFEVPGDGTFTVRNEPDQLQRFAKSVDRTNAMAGRQPPKPKGAGTPSPLGLRSTDAVIKEWSVSNDPDDVENAANLLRARGQEDEAVALERKAQTMRGGRRAVQAEEVAEKAAPQAETDDTPNPLTLGRDAYRAKLKASGTGPKAPSVARQQHDVAILRELFSEEIAADPTNKGVGRQINDAQEGIMRNATRAKIQDQGAFKYVDKVIDRLYQRAEKEGKPIPEFVRDERKAEAKPKAVKAEPKADQAPKPKVAQAESEPQVIEDFGEKLEGARKDMAQTLKRDLSDEDIASLPLSKIWPAGEIDKIEDPFVAAMLHSARAIIPPKPRQPYKVRRWVEQVKTLRSLGATLLEERISRDRLIELMRERRLEGFVAKVDLLQAIDREHWGRIKNVAEFPNAERRTKDGKSVKSPIVMVTIDNRGKSYDGTSVADVIEQVQADLSGERETAAMQFEIRGSRSKGTFFINKKGDPEYRKLKTFNDLAEARAYLKNNRDDLVAAWEAVKERDNVKKTDVRRAENRPRAGQDWRNGKDVTPDQFADTFGFRGVQFGNWVKQGKVAKARQGMLNDAYDALMDLSAILNIPPRALSLNGSLGLAFGARGKGMASAHFEPGNLVINLTKTRGAGSLGHEWFHALDNYFQRRRGDPGRVTRESNFITYSPETYYQNPQGVRIPAREFEKAKAGTGRYRLQNPDEWVKVEGVRPEVEERFAELVKALDESPMRGRAAKIDKGKSDGYWSRIIERAARSFENYLIAKMRLEGYHNDYLANVQEPAEFARNPERYPYLLPDEISPVLEAFDNLFGTIKAAPADEQGNVALYSRAEPARNTAAAVRAELNLNPRAERALLDSGLVTIVQSASEIPGNHPADVAGAYHQGKVYLVADNIPAGRAEGLLLHEVGIHHGLKGMVGEAQYAQIVETLKRQVRAGSRPNAPKAAREAFEAHLRASRSLESSIAGWKQRYGKDMPKDRIDAILWDETIAHMAESGSNAPVIRRLLAAVRAFLRRLGLVRQFTAADMAHLARGSVQRLVEGMESGGQNVPRQAFNPETIRTIRDELRADDESLVLREIPSSKVTVRNGVEYRDPPTWIITGQYGQFLHEAPTPEAVYEKYIQQKEYARKGRSLFTDSSIPARRDGIRSVSQASFKTKADVDEGFKQGAIKVKADRAGRCYECAADAAMAGHGDYVVGTVQHPDGRRIGHAAVQRDDGMIYDAVLDAWFSPEAYDYAVGGWEPIYTLSADEVADFGNEHGYYPSLTRLQAAKNQTMYHRVFHGTSLGADVTEPNAGTPQVVRDKLLTDAQRKRRLSKRQAFVRALNDILNVGAAFGVRVKGTNLTEGDSTSVKNIDQSVVRNFELLGNVIASEPFLKHGYGGLDTKTRSLVEAAVVDVVDNLKIGDSVIELVPIDVVNILGGEKIAAKMALHDVTMLHDRLAVDSELSVAAMDSASSLMERVTILGAEKLSRSGLSDGVTLSADGPTTSEAVEGRQSSDVLESANNILAELQSISQQPVALLKRNEEALQAIQDAQDATRYSFAGQRATTADKHALATAQDRVNMGESPGVVLKETGWFLGQDGKWRFEINDDKASLIADRVYELKQETQTGKPLHKTVKRYLGPLGEMTVDLSENMAKRLGRKTDVAPGLLRHDTLFAAYPELRGLIIDATVDPEHKGGPTGEFAPKQGVVTVTAKNDNDLLSALLHEIQHGIQDIEGFAVGGSPELFSSPDPYIQEKLKHVRDTNKYVKDHYEKADKAQAAGDIRLALDHYNAADSLAKYEAYRLLAGEVEARNVQRRRSMSDSRRLINPPNATVEPDINPEDIIVLFNGEKMQSAPPPANASSQDATQFSRAPAAGTTAFKRWFGNSKLTNPDGSPRVFYHVPSADFTAFDKATQQRPGAGFFFSSDPENANRLAGRRPEGANVMPVYLKADNPLNPAELSKQDEAKLRAAYRRDYRATKQPNRADYPSDSLYERAKDTFDARWKNIGSLTDDFIAKVKGGQYGFMENTDTQRVIQNAGFDAYFLKEGDFTNVAVYEPTQIKSAVGNVAFDPENPDIRYSRAPADLTPRATLGVSLLARNRGDATAAKREARALYPGMAEDISDWIDTNGDRWQEAAEGQVGALYSRAGPVNAQQQAARDAVSTLGKRVQELPKATAQALKDASANVRPALMNLMTRQMLVEGSKDVSEAFHNAAREFERVARAMDRRATSMIQHVYPLAQDWAKLNSRWWWNKTNRTEALNLSRLMHAATLAGVDPSKPLPSWATEDAAAAHAELKQQFDGLSDRAKTIYRKARDAYTDQRNDLFKALMRRMANVDPRAKLPDEMDAFVAAIEQRMQSDEFKPRRAALAMLRQAYESGRKGVYFPLFRTGDYYLYATDPDGNPRFSLFKSQREQRLAMQDLIAQGYDRTQISAGKQIKNLSTDTGPGQVFMASLLSKVEAAGLDEDTAQALKDEMWQSYLHTLPDVSIRKAFIHRKGTAGFSDDALQAFATRMSHGAKQIARLEASHTLSDLIVGMKKQARELADSVQGDAERAVVANRAKDYAAGLDSSLQWMMNPTTARWASRLTSTGFVYFLGLTPGAALVNSTQIAVVTYPALGARFGATKAAAAIGAAYKEYGKLTGWRTQSWWTKKDSAKRKAFDRTEVGRMLLELEESGIIDRTQTASLIGMEDTAGAEFRLGGQGALQAVGFMYHEAERLNREVTAIAAYRLARGRGDSHAKATEFAYDMTQHTQFSYENSNRSAWMRGNAMRVVTLFMQYSTNIAWRMARDAMVWANRHKTAEERRVARNELAGIMGATAFFAGAMGLPFVATMTWLLQAAHDLSDDEDDPEWSAELAIRQTLRDLGAGSSIFEKGVINTLTPFDLAGRTSLSYLFFRPADRDMDVQQTVSYYLEQAAGPVFGIAANAARGVDLMTQGQTLRGFEMMIPKFARDGIRSVRYGMEGATSLRGDPIKDEFSPAELFGQFIGLSPAELIERYEQRSAIKTLEQRVLNRRRSLMNGYYLAWKNGDRELLGDTLKRIRAFNRAHPQIPISGSTIRQSMRARIRYSQEAIDGLSYNKSLRMWLLDQSYLEN